MEKKGNSGIAHGERGGQAKQKRQFIRITPGKASRLQSRQSSSRYREKLSSSGNRRFIVFRVSGRPTPLCVIDFVNHRARLFAYTLTGKTDRSEGSIRKRYASGEVNKKETLKQGSIYSGIRYALRARPEEDTSLCGPFPSLVSVETAATPVCYKSGFCREHRSDCLRRRRGVENVRRFRIRSYRS